jgi:predicted peptidase
MPSDNYLRSDCLARMLIVLVTVFCVGHVQAQESPQNQPDELSAFEERVFDDGQGNTLPYRLLIPANVEGPRPLLLFLHGAGERGDDNRRQLIHGKDLLLKAAQEFGCIVVAPQCPAGSKWSIVDWSKDKVTFSDEPSAPMQLTLQLIDSLGQSHQVDTDRLYIFGLSMGGYGTWDAISREPNRFAAAAPICGGADTALAQQITHVPVWAFHGEADRVVSVDLTRDMIKAIIDAGGDPRYTEYPDTGHNSWTPAFAEPELLPWLTSHSLDPDAAQTQPE